MYFFLFLYRVQYILCVARMYVRENLPHLLLYILKKERGEYLLYLFMHERAYLCLRNAPEKILYIAMNKKLL